MTPAARFCRANNWMCCQLTWWRALGITAQQRPASKKVRTERATPCSSSDMGHRDLQIQFNFFLILLSLWTWKQRDLSRILSAYASASCSEIHSMVPNIYQKTALEEKKKKKKSWQHPTCYRHLLVDTRNRANDKTFLLFHISSEGRR